MLHPQRLVTRHTAGARQKWRRAVERVDAERLQVLVKGSSEKLLVSRTFAHLFRD